MQETLTFTTPTGVELMLPVAGAGSRSYAYIIDWHIRILGVLVWGLAWIAVFYPGFDITAEPAFKNGALWFSVPTGLFYLLYHPAVELFMQGNTPGKNIAGIRCVNLQGEAPGSGAILLRNIMRIIDSLPAFYTLGLVSIIVTRDSVRLGDMVAGTRMVTATDRSDKALAKLDQIQQANIAPKDAEFVQALLERWGSLSRAKRMELGGALLQRYDITVMQSPRQVKKQIKALLQA